LIRRRTDSKLRFYTKRKDYFNLFFILTFLLTGLFSWLLFDHGFGTAREYMASLFTFGSVNDFEPVMTAHVVIFLLLAAYLPFTSMMHFFAKWFTYHKVRWDDAPNLRGSNVERSLESVFNQQVSWSAPHVKSIMRWSDLAQGTTEEEHAPRLREG
jgi:nitrate reductase gamma subunit